MKSRSPQPQRTVPPGQAQPHPPHNRSGRCHQVRLSRTRRTQQNLPFVIRPSRNASRRPRPRPAWTSTRSAVTTPGTGTSRWPCWRTHTCPSRRRPPQKPWQRPHPGHARRGPPSPGTLNRPAPGPRRSPGLVHLAQAPSAPRQSQPLPAKTSRLQRSAAGVLILQRHLGELVAAWPVMTEPGLVLEITIPVRTGP